MDVPWTVLDRELKEAARTLGAAHRQLRQVDRSSELANPLAQHRRLSSRATFLDAQAAASKDPLAAALGDWVYVLTLERVLWADSLRVASAWHAEVIDVQEPEAIRLSARSLLGRVLSEPVAERRRLWAGALARGGVHVADAVRILQERRAEAIRRLGAERPERVEIPCDPHGAVVAAADAVFDRTAPVFASCSSWDAALASALGRRAASGWPAHLTPRWLWELWRPVKLTEGLSLEIGTLPAPLGASSFARALAGFGAAFADAAVPEAAPFALARPPFDLRRARRAALFGGLVADPIFCMRALGLGRDGAREQSRQAAAALVISLRLDAARAQLRGVLVQGSHAARDRFEEVSARALGAPIPGQLAGVVPRLAPEDSTVLMGGLLSLVDRRAMVERFDEDWFRSPHAVAALREEQAVLPKASRTSPVELGFAIEELSRVVSELFG